MRGTERREVAPDEWLTQAGNLYAVGSYKFPHVLRVEADEGAMSLILGGLSPTVACDLRAGPEGKRRRPGRDAARYVRAKVLTDLGFWVEHDPIDPFLPDHCLAHWSKGPWDDEAQQKFCGAFLAPVP